MDIQKSLKKILKVTQGFPTLRRLIPASDWYVDASLVGDIRMKRFNQTYRGKSQTTDVLSFPAPDPFRQGGHLGEIIISSPVMRLQAVRFGHRPQRELEILLIHGVLHLLGFDHETSPAEAKRMASWESKILKEMTQAQGLGLIRRANLGRVKK